MTETDMNVCKFCQEIIYDNNIHVIGEVSKQMLNVLLLKMDFNEDKESVMCLECATKLQNAADFKTTCLHTDFKMSPLVDFKNDVKLVSEEENFEKNTDIKLTDIPEDQKTCQFCNNLTQSGSYTYLQDRKETVFMIDVIQKHIPELHLNVTRELVTCDSCISSLQNLSNFILICSETDGKIKEMDRKIVHGQFKLNDNENLLPLKYSNVADTGENYSNNTEYIAVKNEVGYGKSMEIDSLDVSIKNEEIDIKLEQNDYESVRDTLASSQPIMGNASSYNLNDHRVADQALPEATVDNLGNSNDTKFTYKCQSCSFVAKYKSHLRRHMLIHQQLSEVTAYACQSCSYITKHKTNLNSHNKRMHQSETIVYNCDRCSFKTKYKTSLTNHMLVHQELPEVTVYACESCSFVTKHKNNLIRHNLIHQSSGITVYNCDQCSFKTKYKRSLIIHTLTHRESSDMTIYKCESCSYVTKLKREFNSHRLFHPVIKEYNCNHCSFKTKYKRSLKVHVLNHRESSEATMYKCKTCSYVTNLNSKLKSHNKLSHPAITEYNCGVCSYKTKYKHNLKSHMLVH